MHMHPLIHSLNPLAKPIPPNEMLNPESQNKIPTKP